MQESNDQDVYRTLILTRCIIRGLPGHRCSGTEEEQGFDRLIACTCMTIAGLEPVPVSTTVYPEVWGVDIAFLIAFFLRSQCGSGGDEVCRATSGAGDPGFTSLEVGDWKVEASARKFLGDQVDVLFSVYRDGEKVASPRMWVIENKPSNIGLTHEDFAMSADVDAIRWNDKTRVTIQIEIEEDDVPVYRLPVSKSAKGKSDDKNDLDLSAHHLFAGVSRGWEISPVPCDCRRSLGGVCGWLWENTSHS